MRIVLFAILGLVVLAVAAVLVGPSFVDWNAYKPEIAEAVEESTGRTLSIDGDIDLRVLPSPRLSVAGVRLANAADGTAADMVTLEALQVHVALGPLFSGQVRVDSVTLVRPTIVLETLPDGRGNWQLKGADAPQDGAGSGGTDRDGTAMSVRIERAEIESGTVIYRDDATGEERRIEGLEARIAATSLQGPLTAEGSLDYAGRRIGFDVALGEIGPGSAATLKATMAMADGAASAAFDGTVVLNDGPTLRGTLTADAAKLAEFVAGFAPGVTLPTAFGGAASLAAKIDGSPSKARITDIALGLGDLKAQGSIDASLSPRIVADATISVGRIDLDTALGGLGAGAAAGTARDAPAPGADFALPTDVTLSLAATVDAIDYRGSSVRKLRLDGDLTEGILRLTALTAELPGGSDVTVTGRVTAEAGLPRFVGRVDAVSDNLRAALDWLGASPNGVAPERLRKGAVGADIDATPRQVSLANWTMELDTTRASGGLTLLLRERPAFGLSMVVDKINLDAYLPDATATAGATAPGQAGDGVAAALLGGFDANLDLKVGEAVYRQTTARDVAVDATVQNGSITVRKLAVGDLAGTRLSVQGTLAGALSGPSSNLEISIDTPSVARLARLARIEPTPLLQRIGAAKVSGTVLGSLEAMTVSLKGGALGAAASVDGVVKPLASPPTWDLALKASHPDARKLMAALAPDGGTGLALGPATLIATVTGDQSGKVAVDGTLDIAAGRLALAGTLSPTATPPGIEGRFGFDHPDVVQLVRIVAPDFKPRQRNLGSAKLSGTLSGTAESATLGDLGVTLGPIGLTGKGTVAMSGPRPRIGLTLAAGEIAVDPWLPADAPTPPAGAAPAVPVKSAAREWSRERIDTSGLLAADADLELTAKRVRYGAYILDGVSVEADIADGVLTLERFASGLFGGSVNATGTLAHGDTPRAKLAVEVAKADVRQAAAAAGETGDRVAGILDYATTLTTGGNSEYALVSNLSGTGSVRVADGYVDGIDLPQVSRQLDSLDRSVDFLALAQKALSGGRTPFDSLTGTYRIEQGVLRSDDIELKSSTVAGRATAAVNLPNQDMDLPARFWLVEHPNSPPVGVRLTGPLSNPRRVLDIDKMQAYVLQRVVERGILKQLDRSGQQQPAPSGDGSQPAAQQPAAPDVTKNPEEALKGILRGLLKN